MMQVNGSNHGSIVFAKAKSKIPMFKLNVSIF